MGFGKNINKPRIDICQVTVNNKTSLVLNTNFFINGANETRF